MKVAGKVLVYFGKFALRDGLCGTLIKPRSHIVTIQIPLNLAVREAQPNELTIFSPEIR